MRGVAHGIRDEQRIAALRRSLEAGGLDAVICALPANVLLLSGYWPVVGTAVAIATCEGAVALAAPEDESDLAASGWAEPIHLFNPGSASELFTVPTAVRGGLRSCLAALGITRGRIGWEACSTFEPAPYSAFHLYGESLVALTRDLVGRATLEPAGDVLRRLRAIPTPRELARIRRACTMAGRGFAAAAALEPGPTEMEVAAAVRGRLLVEGSTAEAAQRVDGFVWCMSGPNSARAAASHARTGNRALAMGDLVLVHCNSYLDGFWTDITRTYTIGGPSRRQRGLYQAVFEARQAAIDAIRPGAPAAKVDRAARQILDGRGLGQAFTHQTGHGVGFAAIDHLALPRLHAASPDVLETGMVFNVEPAVYLDGEGGLRHCDMVVVTEHGAEVLTPFQCSPEAAWSRPVPAGARHRRNQRT